MAISTTVKLMVREAPTQVLPGVRVALFDRDRVSSDDRLGVALTDVNGEAHFNYSPRDFADADDLLPRSVALPDLYVEVYNARGETVLSTRAATQENQLRTPIVVPIGRDLVASQHLYPPKVRSTPAQAQADWTAGWRKKFSDKRNPKPRVDLCLTRVMTDLIAGAADPKNDMQKKLAVALEGRLTRDRVGQVSALARTGLRWIDESGLIQGSACSSTSNPKVLYDLLTGPGGTLSQISQSVLETEPRPIDRAGPLRPGEVHKHLYDGWAAKCIAYFKNHALTGQAKSDMEHFYHEPNDLWIIEPPSVAEVEVYENSLQHTVRRAYVAQKNLDIWVFDARAGLVLQTTDMAVAMDSDQLLVRQQDPLDGKQVLVADVVPGQTVSIKGRGFAADKATMTVQFAPWRPIATGVIDPQPLQPDTFTLDATRLPSAAPVHGATPADGRDWVIFDWPASAGPGLYKVQLSFQNNSGLKTTTHPTQQEGDCTLGLIDVLETTVLHFVVLPPLEQRSAGVRASRVECNALTNPPIWPDDISLQGSTEITRIAYDLTDPGVPRLQPTSVASGSWDMGDRVCWIGQSLDPAHPNVLPNDEPAHLFGFDRASSELLTVNLEASEIEGSFDRGVLIATAIVITIAIAVILSAIIVVATILIVVFTAATGGPSAAIAAALVGAVWVAAGLAIAGATALINAVVNGSVLVASPTMFLSGFELAVRLSNVRYHRLLWRFPRPLTGNIHEVRTDRDAQGFHEQYVGSDHGGTYTVHVDLPT